MIQLRTASTTSQVTETEVTKAVAAVAADRVDLPEVTAVDSAAGPTEEGEVIVTNHINKCISHGVVL
jgi:hypothetical protein